MSPRSFKLRFAAATCVAYVLAVGAGSSAIATPGGGGDGSSVLEGSQEGIALLSGVDDGAFAFDDPGFYWFCQFVREHPEALAEPGCGDADVVPWQYLMERPSDYRGHAVCIEGRLLRVQPAYDVDNHPGIGRLRQVDLGVPGSNAIATLVLVDPPPKATKRSLIRTRGVFIKVRSFRSESGGEGAGPIFVARGFDVIEPAGTGGPKPGRISGRDIVNVMGGATIVLFFVLVLLRKRLSDGSTTRAMPTERSRVSGTDDDFDWLNDATAEGADSADESRH